MKKEGLSRFKKIGRETFQIDKQFTNKKDANNYARMLRKTTKARVIVDVGGYIVYSLA